MLSLQSSKVSEGAIEITLYVTEMRECLHECSTRVSSTGRSRQTPYHFTIEVVCLFCWLVA